MSLPTDNAYTLSSVSIHVLIPSGSKRKHSYNVSVSVSHKLLLLDVIVIMTSFLINRCGSSSLIVKTHFYSLTKIDTFYLQAVLFTVLM